MVLVVVPVVVVVVVVVVVAAAAAVGSSPANHLIAMVAKPFPLKALLTNLIILSLQKKHCVAVVI